MDEPKLPFDRDVEYELGELRAFAAQLSSYRQAHQDFSQLVRRNKPPWKVWNEELIPLMYLADGLSLSDDARFKLMLEGHVLDLELIAGGNRTGIQVTIADMVWAEARYPAGQLRALKTEHLAKGYAWGGARLHRSGGETVSEPHARGLEEDVEACKAGLIAALEGKSTHAGQGSTLLVFARDFTQHLYDVDKAAMIDEAVSAAPKTSFDQLYVVDSSVFWGRP